MRRPEVRYPVLIDPYDTECRFPDVSLALEEPNGLLAIGGNLQPQSLLAAYRAGIFPWYEEGQPILWWSPDPRLVLFPDRLKVSQSLRKVIRRSTYDVSFDRAFEAVVRACGAPRAGDHGGTWITEDMIEAYVRLHGLGHAHSAEAWHDGQLVGGLYGVALGRVFFGESMFHRSSDASKVAFVGLVRRLQDRGFTLIDCQMQTAHLMRFGAELVPRSEFLRCLGACDEPDARIPWADDPWPSSGID